MYKRFISAFQMLNILFQSLYCLVLPVGIGALVSYLLTKFASAPKWIWAIFITLGVFSGLYSMVKYILIATKALENLDKGRNERSDVERARQERRERWKNAGQDE
jgi:F0F1-type ATP synthase assembly protein I